MSVEVVEKGSWFVTNFVEDHSWNRWIFSKPFNLFKKLFENL